MNCYSCSQETDRRCRRCQRPYCEQHGAEFCDACLNPAGGLPSPAVFRGSLLALLLASMFAVWLLVSRPALPEGSENNAAPFNPTPLPATNATAVPLVPTLSATAAAGAPAVTSPSPVPPFAATVVATPGLTPTVLPYTEYTVKAGDNLYIIAQQYGVTVAAIIELNSLKRPEALDIGQKLLIPKP